MLVNKIHQFNPDLQEKKLTVFHFHNNIDDNQYLFKLPHDHSTFRLY